ncbi:threonine-phosphate decarboxylase [Aequitasia blattaphilus]|uniref:Aminotransferase class I/II-fold pyridoxal phosphate-dependent enzyme n=1 Tax=Aequitasia blattaphilus TaxID=2949332 RepID=A0ABT1E8L9_9FIRM|nr:threonine-phosphate decarboxylase [Aequitasia blattaphilus]MCP1102165.1 aminotransferase class I/II-fold pyridoxal phosphate-dependent enzyme [Aequitasia blattaphilus]MCR8614805.1 aminotransferase class I/II-fold pyridoxal phosphate-dependent enzyme [Aequitasia blattaphilus]
MKQIHGGDVYTYKGMLDFSTNINPLGPSKNTLDAAREAVNLIGQYPDIQNRRLRKALALEYGIRENQLILGNGAADLIYGVSLAEKPKRALLCAPTFAEYEQGLKVMDCEVEYYGLKEEHQFEIQEDYLESIHPNLDIIFLCTPNNPTGQIIRKELLIKILKRCSELKIRMVVDECFLDFVRNGKECSFIPEIEKFTNLLILRAFTKMYGIPGLRLGYGMSSDASLIERMENVRQPWSVSVVAEAAGVTALKERERIQETKELIERERRWLETELDYLQIKHYPSQANYILLYSKRNLEECLKKERILIRNCGNYKGLQEGYYRIAVRTHEENKALIRALWKGKISDGKINNDSRYNV